MRYEPVVSVDPRRYYRQLFRPSNAGLLTKLVRLDSEFRHSLVSLVFPSSHRLK
jgi:hypothetical protein